jgi:O-antigen ligase
MSWAVTVALIGWFPLVALLFQTLPPRRALLAALLLGWLFLPIAGFAITGLKTKNTIVSVGLLVGLLVAGGRRSLLKLGPIDIPMGLWCTWPAVAAIANGLGAYEAASAVLDKLLVWGVPYAIGKAYFADVKGSRRLAEAIFLGGLIYVPLCLWEIRMSPQLHGDVFGFHQHSFEQTRRGGGFRPTVFMHHGLMVALWMVSASLAGLWLWKNGKLRRLWGASVPPLLAVLIVTAVLCKSTGAIALLALGCGVLLARGALARAIMMILVLAGPAYIAARAAGLWSGDDLVALASSVASRERAFSLQYRMGNEDLIVARALEQPVTGWGRFGRWLPHGESGEDLAVPDQLWVIAMGENGLVGLASLLAVLLFPCARFVARVRSRDWTRSSAAAAVALAVIVTMFSIDSLFNAMINPFYAVAVGALAGFDPSPRALRATRRARASAERPRPPDRAAVLPA